jgi:hypothetical protein
MKALSVLQNLGFLLQAASRLKTPHGYLMCIATNLITSIVLSIYNLPQKSTGQCSGIIVAEPYLSNQFAISIHAFLNVHFPCGLCADGACTGLFIHLMLPGV